MKSRLSMLLVLLLLAGCGAIAGAQQQADDTSRLSGAHRSTFDDDYAAAANGQPDAQYRLAQRYLEGEGTAPHTAQAIIWLERLSKNRDPQWQALAHAQLGELYAGDDSAGRSNNNVRAKHHFSVCAALGDSDCERRLALLTPPGLQQVVHAGAAMSAASLYQARSPAVYKVVVYRQLNAGLEPLSLGSAVAIDAYRAVTSRHLVAQGGVPVSINRQEDNLVRESDILIWQVLYTDTRRDLALLALKDGQRLTFSNRARFSDSVQVGEKVLAIGAPAGFDKTLTEGIVSARRSENGVGFVQTTAPISYGSSGGGLFDESGNLVGITIRGVKAWGNFNFAVAADEVQAFLEDSTRH